MGLDVSIWKENKTILMEDSVKISKCIKYRTVAKGYTFTEFN